MDTVDIGNDAVPYSLRGTAGMGTLSGGISAGTTNFALTQSNGSVSVNDILAIDSEYILVTAISGSNVTNCARGYGGSSAASHSNGANYTATDPTHLNNSGYGVVAQFVANFINAKGW
jgi:hypothetical protein